MTRTTRSARLVGVILAGIALSYAALAQEGLQQAAPEESRRVHYAEEGFSIIPPKGWTPASKTEGLFMAFRDPLPAPFHVNMNADVTVHDATPAKEVALKTRKVLARLFNSYKLLDQGPVTIGGCDAYFIVGRFTSGKLTVQNIQFLIPTADGTHLYVATFTALACDFGDHKPLFLKTAHTVRLSPFP